MINRIYTKKSSGREIAHEIHEPTAVAALAELYRLGLVSAGCCLPTDRDDNDDPRQDKYTWICSRQGQGFVTFATEEEAAQYIIDEPMGCDVTWVDVDE